MSAPDILEDIKADLGITGSTDDGWLQRRIDGVWARMERYTARALCAPPAPFADDWNRMVTQANFPYPPDHQFRPRASVFLRYFPVASIEALSIDGVDQPPEGVRFEPKSGKLFSLTGATWPQDLSGQLYQSRTVITYKAGWATVPPDLYEVVLASVQAAWNARGGSGAGGLPGSVTSINVIDVGAVEMAAGNVFQQATMKGVGTNDPLLGPYTALLDGYVDHRSLIGSALLPVTEPVVVAP